jgi:hypothetical protein
MEVNGFRLPADYAQLCEASQRGEAPDEWVLRDNLDAYGHPWENAGLVLYEDPELMAVETRALERMFREEDRFQHDEEMCRNEPGFIEDFTGIDHYLRIGVSNVGEVYCLDFGADPKEPSVVYWDGEGYWRRVAPDFRSFIALFIDENEAPPDPEDDIE